MEQAASPTVVAGGRPTAVRGRTVTGAVVELKTDGHRIIALEPLDEDGADLPLIVPGLVDLQVNGYHGFDLNGPDVDAATVRDLTTQVLASGTATYCPTLITATETALLHAMAAISEACRNPEVADAVACIHVEGPALSPLDGPRGAHRREWLRVPTMDEIDRWQEASGGRVSIVTVSPEEPGVLDLVAGLRERGIVVAMGHSAADPDDVTAAAEAGITLSTHLGNGSAAMLPRHRNHLWRQLAEDRLTAMFIADGHHLPADAFSVMVRAKGRDRCILTSDAVALAGMPAGRYDTPVGGQVEVRDDGSIRLPGTDFLAGSGASLRECVEWAAAPAGGALGWETAVEMATVNPARVLGLQAETVPAVGQRAVYSLVDPGR